MITWLRFVELFQPEHYLSERQFQLVRKAFFFILVLSLAFFIHGANSDQLNAFVEAARSQIGKTRLYDPAYRIIGYPNGDVPMDRGVCTDVVIRALRDAYDYDLQKLVHEDMKKRFSDYPQLWGLRQPDKNIDHRRVPNLKTFFERNGWALPLSQRVSRFQAGDIVTCIVPPHLPHIMIVSNRMSEDNIPLVIHNIGSGTREENRLLEFQMTGHYRLNGIDQGS